MRHRQDKSRKAYRGEPPFRAEARGGVAGREREGGRGRGAAGARAECRTPAIDSIGQRPR